MSSSPSFLSVKYRSPIFLAVPLMVIAVAYAGAGCSSSSAPATTDGGPIGPVSGALDNHCDGVTAIVVNQASCSIPSDPDAGTATQFGPTIFNAEGDDDDCKYHVKFSVSPENFRRNQNLTLSLTITYKATGAPVTGAANAAGDGLYVESYIDGTSHVLPNPAPVFAEHPASSGIYTATIKFDAAGRWTIRFHLFGNCLDGAEDSPHGHVTFFFDVP